MHRRDRPRAERQAPRSPGTRTQRSHVSLERLAQRFLPFLLLFSGEDGPDLVVNLAGSRVQCFHSLAHALRTSADRFLERTAPVLAQSGELLLLFVGQTKYLLQVA